MCCLCRHTEQTSVADTAIVAVPNDSIHWVASVIARRTTQHQTPYETQGDVETGRIYNVNKVSEVRL